MLKKGGNFILDTQGRHESQSHTGVPPISSYISKLVFVNMCLKRREFYPGHWEESQSHTGVPLISSYISKLVFVNMCLKKTGILSWTLGRQEAQSHTGVPPISSYISKLLFVNMCLKRQEFYPGHWEDKSLGHTQGFH